MERIIEADIEIKNCQFGNKNWIRVRSSIEDCQFGNNIFIGFFANIQNTILGQGIQIASGVRCGNSAKDRVIIEDYVWIGAQAIIEPGVIVHKGAVIGARTHIMEDVPEYSIVRFDREKQKNVVYSRNLDMDMPPKLGEIFNYFLIRHNENSGLTEDNNGNYISTNLSKKLVNLGNSNIFIGGLSGGVAVGDRVKIGSKNIFEGAGKIFIGEDSVIGNGVHILSNSHNHKKLSLPMTFNSVHIGKNVVIGDNVLIFPGISISDNTEVPNGSMILKDM